MIVYRTCKSARVIQVIETVSLRGAGEPHDPVREVTQYWDFAGRLLAELDRQAGGHRDGPTGVEHARSE